MELEKTKAPIDSHGVHTKGLAMTEDIFDSAGLQQKERASIPSKRVPSKSYLAIKRCFDFLASLAVSVIILLPLLLLMTLIMIKDTGRPLYFQKRVGKGGRSIYVAKLRTMKNNSDHLEEMLTPDQLEEYKHEYKLKDDPRLIGWKRQGDGRKCFGGILRRYSLDELPQILFNICIKGDMSLVGPRPILREELEKYYTPEERQEILSVKPGLTGYWQAYARNDAGYETGERQQMELYYIRNYSLRLDIQILFHTVLAVISTRGGVLSDGASKEHRQFADACDAVAEPDLPAAERPRETERFDKPLHWEQAGSAKKSGAYLAVKRCFDIVFSLFGLLSLSPVFLLIAILVRREDHGPVIHRRCCVSATGTYNMLKFRTMVVDADNLEKYLTPKQITEYHTNIKLKDDPRVTRIGHILRKTSLDELPQLLNILRGEMSFVGPRPVVHEELEYFGEDGGLLLTAKPGVTGYWQVHGRSNSTYENGERQRLELYYVEHRSLWMDAVILFQTIPVVLSMRGGY